MAAAAAGRAVEQRVAHQFQAGDVVGGVAAVRAGGVVDRPDAVAAVPGAQGGGGDAEFAGYSGDAKVQPVVVGLRVVVESASGVGWWSGIEWGEAGTRSLGLHSSSCGRWLIAAIRLGLGVSRLDL